MNLNGGGKYAAGPDIVKPAGLCGGSFGFSLPLLAI
jgi:hypothetical protein